MLTSRHHTVLVKVKAAALGIFRPAGSIKRFSLHVENRTQSFLLRMLSPRELRSLNVTTRMQFQIYVNKHNHALPEEDVPTGKGGGVVGARLVWVDAPWVSGCGKVLLYYHGGGLVLPAIPGQLDLMDWLRLQTKTKEGEGEGGLVVAALEYTLGPEKKYPAQQAQAVMALNHLLTKGVPPSDVCLPPPTSSSYSCAYVCFGGADSAPM